MKNLKKIVIETPIRNFIADPHMREIVRGSFVTFILRLCGAGLHFIFNILLAKLLGAQGVGIFFLAFTIATIANVLGRMGLDNALLKFTAANAAVKDWAAVKGVYRLGIKFAIFASIIITLIVLLFAPWLADMVFSKPELLDPIRWMSLTIIPTVLYMLHGELLKGLKRIRDSQIVQAFGVPMLSVLGLYLFVPENGVIEAIMVYVGATVVIACLSFLFWKISTYELGEIKGNFKSRKLFRSSMPLFWVVFLNLIVQWTAIIMLSIWESNAVVGIYSVAYRISMITSFILVSVNSIAAPKFAALYKLGDIINLERTAKTITKIVTLLASPIVFVFLFFPSWVMSLFGEEFVRWSVILMILSIGQFINVSTGSVGYLLMMSGHEKYMRNVSIIMAIINVVLNIILIPVIGIVGAAITTAITLALQNIILCYLVYKLINILTIPLIFSK